MSDNRFSVGDVDLFVKMPDYKTKIEAEKEYKKAFREAFDQKALLRKELNSYMVKRGIWDEEKENEYNQLLKDMNKADYKLNSGKDLDGTKLTLGQAKQIAFDLSDYRRKFRELISERQELDNMTAEGQAETARFSYLVYACTMNFLTQKRYFASFEAFKEMGDDPIVIAAVDKVSDVLYNIDDNYENELTETKFLKRFGFIDDKNRLVNSDGEFVDRDGNVVDEDGFTVRDGRRYIEDIPILEDDETVENAEFEDDLGVLNIEKPKRKRTANKTE